MANNDITKPSAARPQEDAGSEQILSRYASVLLDSTFKRTFGTDKELLMLFLEEVLPGRKIRDITYTNTVNTNHDTALHDSVFDVECVDADTNERFTVELQLDDQEFFYDRALFYASLMIEKQLPKGRAAYEYPPVYVISLQNFRTHNPDKGFMFRFSLHEDSSNEKMTDRLNFIFLELPNARHYDTEGTSITEKICYTLAHMDTFEHRPPKLKEKFFEILFKLLEIATFAPDERVKYQHEMTTERDRINQLDYAKKMAEKKGREIERARLVAAMRSNGMSEEDIARCSGLSKEEISKLVK